MGAPIDALEKKVNRHSYETWLKPTRFSHSQGPTLFVKVPNPVCHIGEKYGDLISEAIENLGLDYQDVEFVTDQEKRAEKNDRRNGDGRSSEAAVEPAAQVDSSGASPLRQQRFDWDGAAQLNPKYTFDGFVIGREPVRACSRPGSRRKGLPRRTTRCSSTAASGWARPT